MGLYADLQKDVIKAFETDLLDATRIIQSVTMVSTYDETTMTNEVVESVLDVRAVKINSEDSEKQDAAGIEHYSEYLIMDQDRLESGVIFKKDEMIRDNGLDYKISTIDIDPAGASYTLSCRGWQ